MIGLQALLASKVEAKSSNGTHAGQRLVPLQARLLKQAIDDFKPGFRAERRTHSQRPIHNPVRT